MSQNRIIVISNIKGGVGKTTLVECFAHYLVMKGLPVIVVDADIQQTLSHDVKSDREKFPDLSQPWNCISLNTLDRDNVTSVLDRLSMVPGNVLIDCPGNLQDPSLAAIFHAADVIVIPFSFDRKTLDGTSTFIQVIKRIDVEAKLVFVPNRILTTESNVEYISRREEAKKVLGQFGRVAARIRQSVVFNRINTLVPLDRYQYGAVEYAFENILEVM